MSHGGETVQEQAKVYVLGGAQTDFARNWARERAGLYEMFQEALESGVAATGLEPAQIEVGHVGNFVGELFAGQGLLGGFFGHVYPELASLPTARHEAACASGSIALLAAMSEIQAGHYGLACVVGLELMRNVPGQQGADNLGAAVWRGREAQNCEFAWPYMFDGLLNEYERRYGIREEALTAISQINFDNARSNPNAQTRNWSFTQKSFSRDDEHNPVIEGRIRKMDCGQITDGAASLFLANAEVAAEHARKQGLKLTDIPYIKGWAHRSAPLLWEEKIRISQNHEYIYPHIRDLLNDLLGRSGFESITELGGMEVHDCFGITEYMAIDHLGITPAGQSWQAIEEGRITKDGDLPINASGGLMGLGHPVGATGVRMLLDCYQQVSDQAGEMQIANANNMATFNVGGSATTCASFILGR